MQKLLDKNNTFEQIKVRHTLQNISTIASQCTIFNTVYPPLYA